MRFVKLLANNWKKTTIATLAAGYGVISFKSYYDTSSHMRKLCSEMVNNSAMWSGPYPKRVLVVINPIANNKKCEKMFKRYCEPVLHLAGYSVEILKTSHIGHAKTFIENMKNLPDAIVVAGGDGTSSEVITGLLRRPESACPVALLPLGTRNESASKYIQLKARSGIEYVQALTSSLLPMLSEKCKKENVIQYNVIENNENHGKQSLKPIFGLNRFSWGLIEDIDASKDSYWYFGFYRHYVAAIVKYFSNLSWTYKADYVYTPPCPGCSNCFVEKIKRKDTTFLSKLISSKTKNLESAKPHISNENCKTQIQGRMETNQLNISCSDNEDNFSQLKTQFVDYLRPDWDFIKRISKITKNCIEPSSVLHSRTIELFPEPNGSNLHYFIDGEEYDIRPIRVAIIQRAIQVYC